MRDKPFIASLLIGFIVILIIAGVSILVKMNSLSGVYKKELAKNISLDKEIEDLKEENSSFEKEVSQLNTIIEELKLENLKINKLKDKLEESLKEELMKDRLVEE